MIIGLLLNLLFIHNICNQYKHIEINIFVHSHIINFIIKSRIQLINKLLSLNIKIESKIYSPNIIIVFCFLFLHRLHTKLKSASTAIVIWCCISNAQQLLISIVQLPSHLYANNKNDWKQQ